jgi:type I restriction enzyme S subunit
MAGDVLGQVVDIVMGQSPPGEACSNDEVGLPLLNGPTEYGPFHPTPVQFTTDARKRARAGDILFCVRGSTTGRMNWADRDYAIGRGVAAIRHKKQTRLQPFVRAVIEYELPGLLAQATGSTFPNVSASQLAGLPWPPLDEPEQRAIAHILGTLDDKIELNRRMSETLEAMARALFKSWFVDFDPVRAKAEGRDPGLPQPLADLFPARLVDSELGEIPEGWEVGTLSDLAALNPEVWSKQTRPPEINYVDLSNTKWGRIASTTVYEVGGAPSRAQRVLRPKDTIVGTVRPGNGSYAFIAEGGLTGSTGFAVLRPSTDQHAEFVYLAATAADNIDALAHLADGGAYPAVRSEVVAATPIVRPTVEVFDRFSRATEHLLAKIGHNERESRTLAALRDTLLPKLISGELRVKDGAHLAMETTA